MNFQDAVRSGFQNYVNFRDRSTRSEFWYWVLFAFAAGLVASILDSLIFGGTQLVGTVVSLGLLLPGIAVSIRRLHDIGRSGWNILWGLIPILGWIYLIYLYVQPSEGPNQYGAAPLQPAAA